MYGGILLVNVCQKKLGGVAEVCEETGFVSLWNNGFVTLKYIFTGLTAFVSILEHIVVDVTSQRAVPHVI